MFALASEVTKAVALMALNGERVVAFGSEQLGLACSTVGEDVIGGFRRGIMNNNGRVCLASSTESLTTLPADP